MSVLELDGSIAGTDAKSRGPGWMGRAWRRFLARQQERQLAVKLARMTPYQLRDMGYDPEAVYGSVEGSWDEVCDYFYRYGNK